MASLVRFLAWIIGLSAVVAGGYVALDYFDVFAPTRPSLAALEADDPKFKDPKLIERGAYLAIVGDCFACHTAPGGAPYAGGTELATPFGSIYATNITQDPEAGIGRMTPLDFVDALKRGRSRDKYLLYPAMPYTAYAQMSDDDALAVYAFMRSVPPSDRRNESNTLRFPFNIRAGVSFWNLLEFRTREFKPDPHRSDEWNRGAYLVEGPGHCGTCHTPKNMLMGDDRGRQFQGANVGGWFAPNLTPAKFDGLESWTQDDIVTYLKTGSNAVAVASGGMREAVENSTSKMSEADLRAVAVYLKSLPAGSGEDDVGRKALPANDPRMAAGAAIYKDMCNLCHRDDGKGVPGMFPALAGNPNLMSGDATNFIRIVLEGQQGASTPAKVTAPAMPSFSKTLKDEEVASVLTYIRNSWGNAARPVTGDEVMALRRRGSAQR